MNSWWILNANIRNLLSQKLNELGREKGVKIDQIFVSDVGLRLLADQDPGELVALAEVYLKQVKVAFRVDYQLLLPAVLEAA